MRSRLEFGRDLPVEVRRALGYATAADAIDDRRGVPVRTTPRCRTFRIELAGREVFRKVRDDGWSAAEREWRALHELPDLGVPVPVPAFLATGSGRTVLGMLAAPGRPVRELLAERGDLGDPARRFLVERAAPIVRALHAARRAHRDLYWNHWFAEALDPAAPAPVLIDVERVFRPSWRWRRWVVKDLAGLVSSWPLRPARTVALRFYREYAGGRLPRGWKREVRAILAKAERIAGHVPRFP